MVRKIFWIIMIVFAILIGLYPGIYFLVERTFGLLRSKSPELLANTFWNIGFYTHIILGGLALLIGWMQFSTKLRNRNLRLHRRVGMIYIIAAVPSSVAGIYIALFATGGLTTSLGFICLGVIWLTSTLKAFIDVKKGLITQHQKLMIFSYAACFSAVTLRIWLPLLVIMSGDFVKAYSIVAWLCWIPNMIVAFLIARQVETYRTQTVA